jgi:hypothetical protein
MRFIAVVESVQQVRAKSINTVFVELGVQLRRLQKEIKGADHVASVVHQGTRSSRNLLIVIF